MKWNIERSRELIVRVSKDHLVIDLLLQARNRIMVLIPEPSG